MVKIFISNIVILVLTCGTCGGTKDYILDTAKCKIPDLEPFNEEVRTLMQPQGYVSCNTSELLTYVKKINRHTAVLHIREDLVPRYSSSNVSCCYSYVTRNGSSEEPDSGISISQCHGFSKSVVLTRDIVKVTCRDGTDESKIVYENVHNPVIVSEAIKAKLENNVENNRRISVLFIVIDSISRLNFIRTMNQTYSYLNGNGFIPMKGYTKVAENTFPNFAGLLTGLNPGGLRKKCKAEEIGGMDACPMIWYDYRTEGYVTAYAEDDVPITTFNYVKKGFADPPTDYYFKPYLEATETLPIRYSHKMAYCTGPETAGERVLSLAKDFATTFKNDPSFGVFWMNTFSHDSLNAPYQMDGKLKQFFVDIKTEGVLNESIVILLSDHGIRFGDILNTQSGWLEGRMPLNMISVPKKFQERFPQEYANLKENSQKLTSTHDLYTTLQHVLTLSETKYAGVQSSACRTCLSLFASIPTDRSCKHAGIPAQWCTCMGHFRTIETDHDYVKNVTNFALSKLCSTFSLDHVHLATISESLESQEAKLLYVVIKTTPPATVYVTAKFKQYVASDSLIFVRRLGAWDLC